MKYWPVPESPTRNIPEPGQSGSFWEDRGDRHHAGVDMYAPAHSDVVVIEDGDVIEVCEFTSPEKIHYWNVTYSILVRTNNGIIHRYAELHDACVKLGDRVKAGELIGHIGEVLNLEKIDQNSPLYIQKLKAKGVPSMLHFEMLKEMPESSEKYLGGNFFRNEIPENLMDPTIYLSSIDKKSH